MTPAETIQKIAEAADAIGWQAGVGGCEMAGAIISYLAAHPEKVDQFFAEGLVTTLGDDDIWGNGCLTFHAKDGTIVTPQQLRIARQVRDLTKQTG